MSAFLTVFASNKLVIAIALCSILMTTAVTFIKPVVGVAASALAASLERFDHLLTSLVVDVVWAAASLRPLAFPSG